MSSKDEAAGAEMHKPKSNVIYFLRDRQFPVVQAWQKMFGHYPEHVQVYTIF